MIASNCPLGMFTPTCATDYLVRVPDDVDVQLLGGGANVDISGVSGVVDVSINDGNVDVRSDPTGDRLIDLHTNGGSISVVYGDDT